MSDEELAELHRIARREALALRRSLLKAIESGQLPKDEPATVDLLAKLDAYLAEHEP